MAEHAWISATSLIQPEASCPSAALVRRGPLALYSASAPIWTWGMLEKQVSALTSPRWDNILWLHSRRVEAVNPPLLPLLIYHTSLSFTPGPQPSSVSSEDTHIRGHTSGHVFLFLSCTSHHLQGRKSTGFLYAFPGSHPVHLRGI